MTSHSFVNHCQTFCSICFSFSFEPANSVILCIGTPSNWISQGNILEGRGTSIFTSKESYKLYMHLQTSLPQILKEQSAWNYWNMKDIYRWVEWSILHFVHVPHTSAGALQFSFGRFSLQFFTCRLALRSSRLQNSYKLRCFIFLVLLFQPKNKTLPHVIFRFLVPFDQDHSLLVTR